MIHSYPWYVSDWRSSETRIKLSPAERCLYRELLDYCWMEGSMPVEDSALAAIAAFDLREFRKCWRAVSSLFVERDGRLTHHRVIEGRGALVAWHDAKRIAGKKGGLGRAIARAKLEAELQANSDSASSKSQAVLKPSPSSSVPPSLRSGTPPPSARKGFEPIDGPDPAQLVRDAVEECAKIWPKIGDKRHAAAAWERAAAEHATGVSAWCEAIKKTAKAHAPAQIAAKQADKSHFIPTLERWVVSGDYTSPPPPVIRQQRGPIDLGENLDG